MKILQICNKPPFPPFDGGSIGMHNITQGLLDSGHQVKVLAVNTPKHFVDVNNLPQKYRDQTQIEFGFINTNISIIGAVKNMLFSKRSYNIVRFENKEFEELLIRVLQEGTYDVIQIESIFLNQYVGIIRKYSNAKIVLRSPNVEYMIWERMAMEERNPMKRFYLNQLAVRLKREELNVLNTFDAIYTVTKNDLEIYRNNGCTIPMDFIPTGVDVTKNLFVSESSVEFPSIFHIGALDWLPNREGLIWFLEKVWKDLNIKYPDLKFYIAGRGNAAWFQKNKYPNVELLGEINNAADFIKSKAIMVVPLFSGSGMRVKIIEGMTLAKAIVSTSIGIEGISHKNEHDVLIADSPELFLKSIESLIENKPKYDALCKNAQNSVNKNYSNSVLTNKLISFLELKSLSDK